MAQHKPKKASLDEVLHLIENLPADEQEKVRVVLNRKTRGERWRALRDKVQNQCSNLPELSDEEILAESKAIRNELKADRAQGSH